jgi:D-3-phosphoglycerate dehydrogenase
MSSKEADEFAKVNAELIEVAESDKAGLAAALKDADILLYGGVTISREMIESAPKLVAILFQTVGYDQVDLKAATENKILVVNNPSWEWCIEEVSNHALALMLGCAKKMKQLDLLVTQGRWADAKKEQNPMGSIYNQTLGVIGCGAIGRMVARKAKVFGLNIIGYDPYIMHPWLAKENGIKLVSFEEVVKADYITLHPDLNETSFHIMNDKAFAQMKPSAYVINTSRGKVIDEVALVKALQEKKIAGAGLDVFETEPLSKDSPLTKMDNVIMLPHSASYSNYAFSLMPIDVAKEAARILSGKWPLNPVNKEIRPRITLAKGN